MAVERVRFNPTEHHVVLEGRLPLLRPRLPVRPWPRHHSQLTSPCFHSRPNPDHLPPPGYDDMYL